VISTKSDHHLAKKEKCQSWRTCPFRTHQNRTCPFRTHQNRTCPFRTHQNKHIICNMPGISNSLRCDAVCLTERFTILWSTSVPVSSRLSSPKTQRGVIWSRPYYNSRLSPSHNVAADGLYLLLTARGTYSTVSPHAQASRDSCVARDNDKRIAPYSCAMSRYWKKKSIWNCRTLTDSVGDHFSYYFFAFIKVIAKPRPLQRTLTALGHLPYLFLNNDPLYSSTYLSLYLQAYEPKGNPRSLHCYLST